MNFVSADEVHDAIKKNQPITLLDVRTPQEYVKGHITGSVHIPLDLIEEKITEAIMDKSTVLYVYCLSGSRSISAVAILNQLGYKNAFSLASGLLAWRAKGYELVTH